MVSMNLCSKPSKKHLTIPGKMLLTFTWKWKHGFFFLSSHLTMPGLLSHLLPSYLWAHPTSKLLQASVTVTFYYPGPHSVELNTHLGLSGCDSLESSLSKLLHHWWTTALNRSKIQLMLLSAWEDFLAPPRPPLFLTPYPSLALTPVCGTGLLISWLHTVR